MTTQKTWSAEEKLAVVMEGLKPRANVAELCRRHGISGTTYYEWKDRALGGMKTGLANKEGSAETALRHENSRLKRLVADQALALQVFREELEGGEKTEGGRSRRR